jgi:tetratricopeptide (TPR) repeat protein
MEQNKIQEKVDRYPGLWPFVTAQSELFFGREEEKRVLLQHVKTSTVTVLFAKSGVGKSSLLNAGVVPLLSAAEYETVNVQFTKTKIEQEGRNFTPMQLFRSALSPWSGRIPSPFPDLPCRLWEEYKSCLFRHPKQVFVFDQFEELFAYGSDDIVDFLNELSELIHELPPSRVTKKLLEIPKEERTEEQIAWGARPQIRLIFAIRSDRLSDLQKVDELIPGIFSNRYELQPMNDNNAKLAIQKPAEDDRPDYFCSDPFSFDPIALQRIINNLKDEHTGEIEPAQLQIICRYIEDLVKQSGEARIDKITVEVFDADKETDNVLHNYYEKQLLLLGNPDEQLLCRNLLENDLLEKVNETYVRPRLSEGKVIERLNDRLLLQRLLATRLIKAETDEGITYYQLSHDSLRDPILKSKRNSEEKEQILFVRNSQIAKAKEYVNQHYFRLKEKNFAAAMQLLEDAESIYETFSERTAGYETKVLIAKALESQDKFPEATSELEEILPQLDKNADGRLLGIVNESLGIIRQKKGDEVEAIESFKKALGYYDLMHDYQQKARLLEHMGGLKEEFFYNLDPETAKLDLIEKSIAESRESYTDASHLYTLINDLFGYERTRRSLRRLQENLIELRTPGFIARPWGFLTELFTGKVHPMKGKGIQRIGRDVYDKDFPKFNLKNEIGFTFKGVRSLVSRRHASISPDLLIEDTQSLNGTTINNRPLVYGSPKKLKNGDIIVLGDSLPLLFTIEEPGKLDIEKESWALLVEGSSRSFHYLQSQTSMYSLSIRQNETKDNSISFALIFNRGETEDAVIVFRKEAFTPKFYLKNNLARIFTVGGGKEKKYITGTWRVLAITKDGRQEFKDEPLVLNQWEVWDPFPMQFQFIPTEKGASVINLFQIGPKFQLVVNQER